VFGTVREIARSAALTLVLAGCSGGGVSPSSPSATAAAGVSSAAAAGVSSRVVDGAGAAATAGTRASAHPNAGVAAVIGPVPSSAPAGQAAPAPVDPRIPPEVTAAADDWPLPNFDYDNTRKAKTTLDSSNIARLQEAWRFTFEGAGGFGSITANLIVMGSVIYFQDMMSNVYALDRSTGKTRWSRMFNQTTFGPNGVAIGWGKLFAAADDSTIVALNLEDGSDIWQFSPRFSHSEGIAIQPLVYDHQLYTATVPVSVKRGVYEGGSHGIRDNH
jgi:glucose dehydrogenase